MEKITPASEGQYAAQLMDKAGRLNNHSVIGFREHTCGSGHS